MGEDAFKDLPASAQVELAGIKSTLMLQGQALKRIENKIDNGFSTRQAEQAQEIIKLYSQIDDLQRFRRAIKRWMTIALTAIIMPIGATGVKFYMDGRLQTKQEKRDMIRDVVKEMLNQQGGAADE